MGILMGLLISDEQGSFFSLITQFTRSTVHPPLLPHSQELLEVRVSQGSSYESRTATGGLNSRTRFCRGCHSLRQVLLQRSATATANATVAATGKAARARRLSRAPRLARRAGVKKIEYK